MRRISKLDRIWDKKISDHVFGSVLLSREEVFFLYKKYPRYTYEGLAYRGLYSLYGEIEWTSHDYNYEYDNICWSLSPHAIHAVLRTQGIEGDDIACLKVYQAQVCGFDLGSFLHDIGYGAYSDEKEILALEYSKPILHIDFEMDSRLLLTND